MNFIAVLNLFSILFFMLVPTLHAMHIYQQNRYQLERYITWCARSVKTYDIKLRYLIWYVPCIGIAILRDDQIVMTLLTLLLFVYGYLLLLQEKRHVYIQALSYTKRIKRLILMLMFMLFLASAILTAVFPSWLICVFIPLIYLLPWGILVLAGACMMPIEESIRDYYMNDASRILKEHSALKTIAITGSFGKTSTKQILYQLLNESYYCFMTPASYNNKMGITKSIREYLKPLHEIFICEMGADHIHEIEQLAKFVKPNISIVTAVGPQHIQTFGSLQNILHEKMQLVEQLDRDGIAFLNRDNEYIRGYHIRNNCRCIWYGIHETDVDYRAINLKFDKTGTSFQIQTHSKTFDFHTKLLGEHNVLNILAAVAVGDQLKVDMKMMQKAVAKLHYVEHRLEVKQMNGFTLIDNAYNSNPVSSRYALDVLSRMDGRRIIITPGFIDLGAIEHEENRKFGAAMKGKVDDVILVGKHQSQYIMKGLIDVHMPYEHVHTAATLKEALEILNTFVKDGDTVLIENDLPDAFNH